MSHLENNSGVGASSTDTFYRSKAVQIDKGEGYVIKAEIELQIETEAFQVNMNNKELILPRLGLKYTLNSTDHFTVQTSQGTISSSLTEMPQTECQQHKDLGHVSIIKHEPRVSEPGKMCRVIKITAPNGL